MSLSGTMINNRRISSKKYFETHKEQIRNYRIKNKEKIKLNQKEYKEKNKETLYIKQKEYNSRPEVKDRNHKRYLNKLNQETPEEKYSECKHKERITIKTRRI